MFVQVAELSAQALVAYHLANGGVSRYKKFAYFLEALVPAHAPGLQELRQVFAQRGLAHLFDGGIYGSPDTKEKILARELHTGNIRHPALYLGDSKYDHQAATAAGLDFLFLHGWSEVESWQEWLSVQKINGVSGMRELLGGVGGQGLCVWRQGLRTLGRALC